MTLYNVHCVEMSSLFGYIVMSLTLEIYLHTWHQYKSLYCNPTMVKDSICTILLAVAWLYIYIYITIFLYFTMDQTIFVIRTHTIESLLFKICCLLAFHHFFVSSKWFLVITKYKTIIHPRYQRKSEHVTYIHRSISYMCNFYWCLI